MIEQPLQFRPVYQTVVWGGRRMERWRSQLPEGPIGESWDLADHDRGMSVVADGPLAGRTLRSLTEEYGERLVGAGFAGGDFPLMIKLIDANQRLSVQVHPDDALARQLEVGPRGKTECWFLLGEGGELFQGTKPGVTKAQFQAALAAGELESLLQRFETSDGAFYFLPARTVHALGTGCLLYEIQQTCDVTFRVYDWGRLGLDGKPRQTHVSESLQTIDFERPGGPVDAPMRVHPQSGTVRDLCECPYFEVSERCGDLIVGGDRRACSAVICLDGEGVLSTRAGSVLLRPMTTTLVPAEAGEWLAQAASESLRLLVSRPRFL